MKKIISVFVLALVFLFTSVNETYADRLGVNKGKSKKKGFEMVGFVFQPLNGVKFAVVDDGLRYNIFYDGDVEISINCGKDGTDVSITFKDGKKGAIRIPEVRLSGKRNKVLAQKVMSSEMLELETRFAEEQ